MSHPQGRAVTPAEKRAVVERLYASWLQMPEQRLGQLLENSAIDEIRSDLFSIEDREFAASVEAFAETSGTRKAR